MRAPRTRELLLAGAAVWALGVGCFVGLSTPDDGITPGSMIPAPCDDPYVEGNGIVRDVASNRCWINVESFRHLHPLLAPLTDLKASTQQPSGAATADDEEEDGIDWAAWLARAEAALGPLLIALSGVLLWRNRHRPSSNSPALRPV